MDEGGGWGGGGSLPGATLKVQANVFKIGL